MTAQAQATLLNVPCIATTHRAVVCAAVRVHTTSSSEVSLTQWDYVSHDVVQEVVQVHDGASVALQQAAQGQEVLALGQV
jgi:hypothetical protein